MVCFFGRPGLQLHAGRHRNLRACSCIPLGIAICCPLLMLLLLFITTITFINSFGDSSETPTHYPYPGFLRTRQNLTSFSCAPLRKAPYGVTYILPFHGKTLPQFPFLILIRVCLWLILCRISDIINCESNPELRKK